MNERRPGGSFVNGGSGQKSFDMVQPKKTVNAQPIEEQKPKNESKIVSIIVSSLISIVLVACSVGVFLIYKKTHSSPVPKSISKQVDFPVYYPDVKKLPAGYTLNLASFKSPQKGIVLYAVNYEKGKLVFSIQKQPSDDEIQSFYTNYIPLRNKFHTDLGQAELGAHTLNSTKGLQTVVSLPTYKGSWIIVTAPYDVDQKKMVQVLNSLKK